METTQVIHLQLISEFIKIYTYDIEDKSLVEVIRVLGNIEASSGGQDKLTNKEVVW